MTKSLAVLISNAGSGTNLQAIIDAIKNKSLNAKICVVISSDSDAYGLTRAKRANLKFELIEKKAELLGTLNKYKPDYVCLAGWKQIIPKYVFEKYKILNIHPGLIPESIGGQVLNPDGTKALWNRGRLTSAAIQNFLDINCSFAGSSVHFLSDEFDFGKVMGRTFEKIRKGDSVGSLYSRLKKKENRLYVDCLIKLCK